MAKRILIYSSFPPTRCGIGRYAAEQVKYEKSKGNIVLQCSPDETSSAAIKINLNNYKSILMAIWNILWLKLDAVFVHYTSTFIYSNTQGSLPRKYFTRICQILLFYFLGWKGRNEGGIIFHETGLFTGKSKLSESLLTIPFHLFHQMIFHTEPERKKIIEKLGSFWGTRATVLPHERYMQSRFTGSQRDARNMFGLDQSKKIFLCIGFFQQHKGFHLAIEAFEKAKCKKNAELYIVGSLRTTNPKYSKYRDELYAQAHRTEGVYLIEEFVDDDAFDAWIVASDCVILPYLKISSSGVGARTRLLGRPLIVNGKTNLGYQFQGDNEVLQYENSEGLMRLLKKFEKKSTLPEHSANYNSSENVEYLSKKPILFVMPWFFKNIQAGAEKVIFTIAEKLCERGINVEVWATASSTLVNRNNHYLDGQQDQGTPFEIVRFPSNKRMEPIFNIMHRQVAKNKGSLLTGWLWKKSALSGKGMEKSLRENAKKYSTIHLCHYFSGSSHRLASIAPEKTILHPFIHNEPAAYHKAMSWMFSCARGAIINSAPEIEVGIKSFQGMLPDLYFPIGVGVSLAEKEYNQISHTRKQKNQLIYIGRIVQEKNISALISWITGFNDTTSDKVSLLFVGEGHEPEIEKLTSSPYVEYAGWVEEDMKIELIRDSLALVQPSLFESFSLVIMEAWALKTPVIVHADCSVTKYHVNNSEGGFAVRSQSEFNSALDILLHKRVEVSRMAESGYNYVTEEFKWSKVIDQFLAARKKIMNYGP
ncbi:glycosyltransferase [Rhodohalobacter sulfatireducens]|uniref:Glycosyltransferase n=1 Tax=Rhodohalobacter sulfatireducens TaxID=2911366 RepID=A0ABS9KAU9_9BACT|nr:glycosyltransferase [Rhodohalobacter sulfatireducens]MCG2587958.1 glycosyltransferase [Rhodohalobacter sulfatireducens]